MHHGLQMQMVNTQLRRVTVFNEEKKSKEVETEMLFGWNKNKCWCSLLAL